MYSSQTEFTNIPDENIKIVSSTNKTTECGTIQTMDFALLFKEEMDGGKLRCRISESGDSEDLVGTVSEPLMLIPRTFSYYYMFLNIFFYRHIKINVLLKRESSAYKTVTQ